MYERLLLATDGSQHAETAARHAIALADRCGATLHVISVIETRTAYDNAIVEPDAVRENLQEIAEDAIATVEQLAAEEGVPTEATIQEGVPAKQIVAYVDAHDIDFVVIGEQGHSRFKTVLLGSTAEGVIHNTDVPVTVV